MATATKTPRLLAAAKEFNIGKDTLVEYLIGKGFDINASNPNTKLTEEMYDALQREFAQDKLAKRKSEEIALPKGSLIDGLKKSKEDLDISPAKGSKKTPETETPVPAVPKEEKVIKPAEDPAPAPVAKQEPEAKEDPAPAPTPEPVPVSAKEESTPAPVAETPVPVAPKAVEEEEADAGHIETKAPKLEGPNILGKINLVFAIYFFFFIVCFLLQINKFNAIAKFFSHQFYYFRIQPLVDRHHNA